jgi:hypothetical protein
MRQEDDMHRWIIALGTALLVTAIASPAQANPLMPVQRLDVPAASDDAVTQVHYRPWRHRHYRHYGWYRGRHYGWNRYRGYPGRHYAYRHRWRYY